RVDRVGHRRIGRGRQHVLLARQPDDVRRMAAARPLGVESGDGAALEGGARGLDEARFVQRVGVDRDLHVHAVGDGEAIVDRRRRGAPVLVQLQPAGAGFDLLLDARGLAGVALAEEAQIHRQALGRLQHAAHVPRTRRDRRCQRPVRRTGAAAHHGGDAAIERIVDLLRADEMDVAVDAARGDDLALTRDRLGTRADDDGHARLDIGIAGLADADDAAVPEADVGFHDPPMVEDQRVGDHGIHRALRPRALALAHAVADHLAAAELHLLAVDRVILLDLDEEIGVGEPHLVADGRAEHAGIGGARDARRAFVRRPDLGDRPQLARDPGLEAVALARSEIGRQPHRARLAGLEAHRRAGSDVEPHALGALAVELQRLVGLEEMVVAADLDRPVTGVGDLDRDRIALLVLVEFELALRREDLTGLHGGSPQRIGLWTVTSLVPSGKVASTWISWIISATPSITCSRFSTVPPSRISSATARPSRAPSTTKSVISATASGWLSLTPRSSRRRATLAAMAISSLSFSRGVRFMFPPSAAPTTARRWLRRRDDTFYVPNPEYARRSSFRVGLEVLPLEHVQGQGLRIHPVYVLVLVLKLVKRRAVGAVELHPADLLQRLRDLAEVVLVGLQDCPVAIGRAAIGRPVASRIGGLCRG